ncbi:MAG: outer membrane beta-barrel protein [Cellvibrionaceae bacterium]|nr:outer membrane beta-barrel protein [Cellvibrionaceae bacterium]MCV6627127.1 outer membrane beta-barrel protein [Cellvibrionaceae bacterium]
MKATLKPLTLAAAVAACVMAGQAQAYEAGDIFVRAGATSVNPDGGSSNVFADGAVLAADSGVDVDNDVQLGLTLTYMVTNEIGLEVLAATPFSHTATGKGPTLDSLGVGDIAKTKHLPPTISAVYHFNTGGAITPYVGLGLNYTFFFDEEGGSDLEAGVGNLDVDIEESWGLAYQVGMDIDLGDNMMINASIRYIDIDTTANLDVNQATPALGLSANSRLSADLDIDPMVYSIMFGYKF